MNLEDRRKLDRIFQPRGLALFGGINTPASFGQLFYLSQLRYGFSQGLYPISSKGGELAGRRIYRDLSEIPGPVDLAAISLPATAVPEVLRDCLRHGLAGAQVHSSGFAETGEAEGLGWQQELTEIAGQGLRIIGPNCFGIHCPTGGLTLLPGSDFSRAPGPVALISQSGGVATDFGYEAGHAGLGISKIVSYGNGCDLDAVTMLDYLADDPNTGFIGAYLEGVRDGRQFLELTKQTTPHKPVVIWKAGLTPLGGRAAQSHTGSLAGQSEIWTGALAQAGAIMVSSLDELIDALVALYYLRTPGPRMALVGGGGAIGVYSSDLASSWGLQVPRFSRETQEVLRRYFPTPGNSLVNPLDVGSPILPVATIRGICQEVLIRESIDVLVLIFLMRPLEVEFRAFMEVLGMEMPPRGAYLEEMLPALAELKAQTGKDIAIVFDNRSYRLEDVEVEAVSRRARQQFQAAGFPVFTNALRALRGIRHATNYRSGRP